MLGHPEDLNPPHSVIHVMYIGSIIVSSRYKEKHGVASLMTRAVHLVCPLCNMTVDRHYDELLHHARGHGITMRR